MATSMDTPGLLDSIEAKCVEPRPDCLIWPGAVDRGYGRVYVDGTAKRVHRVVWELRNGPIPEGLTIDHLCRIRSCCNTDHMELVTAAENYQRSTPYTAEYLSNPDRLRILGTHCKNGHRYEPETTRMRPNGTRVCLVCRRAGNRRRAETTAVRLADTG
jgi:hypothetical protein